MEEHFDSDACIDYEDANKSMHVTPKEAPVYGGQSIFVSCGGDSSSFKRDRVYYLVFEGSRLRHLTSAKLINPFTLQAIIPDHDIAEIVVLTIAYREEEKSVTLCKSTFTFTLDTTSLLAQSLAMNSTNSSALKQLELMYGSLFVGPRDEHQILDNRLTLAFKQVQLTDSWSLSQDNDWTLLHLCAKYGMTKLASFLIRKKGAAESLTKTDENARTPIDIAKEKKNIPLIELFSRPYVEKDVEEAEPLHAKPVVKRHKLGTTTISGAISNIQRSLEEDAKLLEELHKLAMESNQAPVVNESRQEQSNCHPLGNSAHSLQKLREINLEIQRLRSLTKIDDRKDEGLLNGSRARSLSCPDSFNDSKKEKYNASKRYSLSLKSCNEETFLSVESFVTHEETVADNTSEAFTVDMETQDGNNKSSEREVVTKDIELIHCATEPFSAEDVIGNTIDQDLEAVSPNDCLMNETRTGESCVVMEKEDFLASVEDEEQKTEDEVLIQAMNVTKNENIIIEGSCSTTENSALQTASLMYNDTTDFVQVDMQETFHVACGEASKQDLEALKPVHDISGGATYDSRARNGAPRDFNETCESAAGNEFTDIAIKAANVVSDTGELQNVDSAMEDTNRDASSENYATQEGDIKDFDHLNEEDSNYVRDHGKEVLQEIINSRESSLPKNEEECKTGRLETIEAISEEMQAIDESPMKAEETNNERCAITMQDKFGGTDIGGTDKGTLITVAQTSVPIVSVETLVTTIDDVKENCSIKEDSPLANQDTDEIEDVNSNTENAVEDQASCKKAGVEIQGVYEAADKVDASVQDAAVFEGIDFKNAVTLDDIEIHEITEKEEQNDKVLEVLDSKCDAAVNTEEASIVEHEVSVNDAENKMTEYVSSETRSNVEDKGDCKDSHGSESSDSGPQSYGQQDFAGRSNVVQELRLLSAVTEETEEELLELDGKANGDFQKYGKSHSLEEIKKIKEQEQRMHWSAEQVYFPREVAVLRRGILKKERPLSDNYENIKMIEREYELNRLSKNTDSEDSMSGLDKRKSKSLDALLIEDEQRQSPSLTSSQVSIHGSVESLPSIDALDSCGIPLYRTRSVGANEIDRRASLNDICLSVKDEIEEPVRLNKKRRSRFSFKRKSKSTTALDKNEPNLNDEDRRKTIIGGISTERLLTVRKSNDLETTQRRILPEEKRYSNRDSGIDSTCDLHLDDIIISASGNSKETRSVSDGSTNLLHPQRDRHRSSSEVSGDRDTEDEIDADTDEGTSSEIAERVRKSSIGAEEKKKEKKFGLLRSKPKKDKKHKDKEKDTLDAKSLKKSQKELKSTFLGKKPSFRQGQRSTLVPTSISTDSKMYARSSSIGKSGATTKHSASMDNLRGSGRGFKVSPSASRKTTHEVDGVVDSDNSMSNLNILSNLSVSTHSLDSLSYEELADAPDQVDDWSEYDSDLAIKNEPETWSNLVERKVQRKLHAKDIKRQDVIYELIFTESNYVRTLKIVSRIYRTGFKRELGLDDQTIDELVPRIDDLLEINGTFCKRMKKRQEESNNNVIEDIGDILVDQFSGQNGEFMKEVYGYFCSRHLQAVALYKELLKTDKKFAIFVKKCMQNALVRRLSIPECITLATQRLTKYPLLFEAILKATKESKGDYDNLKKALKKVKEVLQAVDDYVRHNEKEQDLLDIKKRFDARGEVQYKHGQTFKNSKLFSKRSVLIHDGTLTWKGKAKSVETKAVLFADKIFFLQEKDQRFSLLSLDNKAPVIYLRSLIVREVATDMKALYLVNNEGPEMYELVCPTTKSKMLWKNMIMDAIKNKPDDEEENQSDLEEEMRKEEEIRIGRLREIMEQLQATDNKFSNLITDKNTLVLEMRELIEKMVSSKDGTSSNLDLKATDVLEGRETLEKAISEAGSLTALLCDGELRLQPSAAQQSSAQAQAVPKRAETFSGFDRNTKLLVPPPQVSRASSLKQENRLSLTGKNLGILENDHAIKDPKERIRKTSQGLMSVITRSKPLGSSEDLSSAPPSNSNLQQLTSSTAQKILAVTQLKDYLTSLMDVTNKQDIELASIRVELLQSRSEVNKLRSERQIVEDRLAQQQKEFERQISRQREGYAKLEREFKRTVEKFNKQLEENKLQHQLMKDKYTELHKYAYSMQNSGKSNKNSFPLSSLRQKHHALQEEELPAVSNSDPKRHTNNREDLDNQDVIFF